MFRIPEKYTFGLLLLLVAFIYFIYFPVSYDFDGTVFSHYLRFALVENNPNQVVQSHHLLYFPLNFILYKTLNQLTGYHVLEYFHLQLFSLLFGISTLFICFKMVKRIVPDMSFSVLAILLIASSYGFWYYSVEAEVHMAGLFFIVTGVYVLFFQEFNLRNIILSALLFSLAAGFHLTHGLILFGVLFFFIYEKKPLVSAIWFYFFYAVFFVLPYLAYYLFTRINFFSHFRSMLFGKNPFTGYRIDRWQDFSLASFLDNLRAIGKSIFCPESGLTLFLSVIFLVLILALLMVKKQVAVDRKIYYKFIFWILPYFVFFSFWESNNLEFKLGMVIPLWMIFIYSAYHSGHRRRILPLLLIFFPLLFTLNFFGSIKPRNDIHANKNYLLSQSIRDHTPEHSTVVIAGSGENAYTFGKIYIPYFALRNVLILDWQLGKGLTLKQLLQEIRFRLLNRERIFFLSEILSLSEPVNEILRKNGIDRKIYGDFLQRMNFSQEIRLTNGCYLKEVLQIRL